MGAVVPYRSLGMSAPDSGYEREARQSAPGDQRPIESPASSSSRGGSAGEMVKRR
jgi:hypothetical protein